MAVRPSANLFAAVILAFLISPAAGAQTLDFGPAPEPQPGWGSAALALADDLESQIEELAKAAREASPDTGYAAAIALRRLAVGLLRTGEEMGPEGSAHVVAGRSLAGALPLLHRVLFADRGVGAVVLELVAAEANARAADIPEGPDAVDRLLRDTLAPLAAIVARPGGPAGWVHDPPRPLRAGEPLDVQSLADLGAVSAEALRRIERSLADAEGLPAYQRSVHAVRAHIRAAAELFELDQRWLEPAHERLAADFNGAVLALAERFGPAGGATGGADPIPQLARLSRIARLVPTLDRLGTDQRARAVRGALADHLAYWPDSPRAAYEHERAFGDFLRAADLLLQRDRILGIGAAAAGPRQLRPAWRILERDLQHTYTGVVAVMPDMLNDPGADPGALAAVAAMRRTVDDMDLLREAGQRLTFPRPRRVREIPATVPTAPPAREPVVVHEWQRFADRFLELGQAMTRGDDSARDRLRDVASRTARFAVLPGEEQLRGHPARPLPVQPPVVAEPDRAGWSAVTGGRDMELLDAIERARERWVAEVVGGGEVDSPRLESLRLLMAILNDAAGAAAVLERRDSFDPWPAGARSPGRLVYWPGWELSATAFENAVADARGPLAGAAAAVLDEGSGVEQLLSIRREHAPLLLLGRLEREAVRLGIGGRAIPADALYALVAGAPLTPDPRPDNGGGVGAFGSDPPWMAGHRLKIAHVCRYLEEIYGEHRPEDGRRLWEMRGFVRGQAVEVLEAFGG